MLRRFLSKKLYALADKTFYKLTKNIENPTLKKKLGMIDYPYPEGMYIAAALTAIALTFVASFIASALIFNLIVRDPVLFFVPFMATAIAAFIAVIWPDFDLGRKKKIIEANLPLAILTMSTITQAGAPPQYMFQTIANNPEYPRLSKECQKIQRFMNRLGLSLTKAIDKMAEITPSPAFRTFLKELNTTVKSGGDLREFMSKRAEDAYFKYMMMLERAAERAETMGEIYTILMIAAPLFIFFTIMMLNMFSAGKLFGLTINDILLYGIFVGMPLANLIFMFVMYLMSTE
jgi:flagellar protein FlaJ